MLNPVNSGVTETFLQKNLLKDIFNYQFRNPIFLISFAVSNKNIQTLVFQKYFLFHFGINTFYSLFIQRTHDDTAILNN
jgi:hypothetical protein